MSCPWKRSLVVSPRSTTERGRQLKSKILYFVIFMLTASSKTTPKGQKASWVGETQSSGLYRGLLGPSAVNNPTAAQLISPQTLNNRSNNRQFKIADGIWTCSLPKCLLFLLSFLNPPIPDPPDFIPISAKMASHSAPRTIGAHSQHACTPFARPSHLQRLLEALICPNTAVTPQDVASHFQSNIGPFLDLNGG